MTYIVTKNNPYYPSVEYFGTLDKAKAQQEEWLKEMASPDGTHTCEVTVATVIDTYTVKSAY